ncbi:DEAD/DEAH box helicase family protein [Aeromonas jandaei]|uniref:DEAD/DEAH box helicase family protein n=1 Tax=Aeromonas jandaei TaxID=650 RepID=UPI001F3E97CC|nr:DEAD/DEAH box helicase family protein [Aeromonas jandaei]MCF7717916.1 DEAD/DEAH box helicase family protein [Aeromonas jandaei]
MVDFTKKLRTKDIVKEIDPLRVYESLDRKSETGPLRPSQKEILNLWYKERRNAKNNIIKLHTGEGKTLIGLLILQSKLNAGEGPCMYICPNIYLARQVKAEAAKFGFQICDFDGEREIPDEYLSGRKILVTHVQKVFNGKTIFGLGNKAEKAGAIILDDSHACIDAIKNSLSIKLDNEHPLYKGIRRLFEEDIRWQGEGSYLEIKDGNYDTMLPIPYWAWLDKSDEVTTLINEHIRDDRVTFIWPLIKNSIKNCQAFISGRYLEISPTLMPIEQFGTFHNAQNRILMSATTQDDSFFIKGLGFDIESVKSPLINPVLKWSGEKMILIPSLIGDGIDASTILNRLMKPNSGRTFGVVSLIPSFAQVEQYEKMGATVARRDDIFETVKSLKEGYFEKSVVFANRYDGIDLPDDSCRLLFLDSKPFFDSLSDRYEEECRGSSDIINVRIAQKVEQGLGRSVRGEKDYSVIFIIGGDLVQFIKSSATSKYFSPQTRKQIEIGLQIVEFAKEDNNKDAMDILIDLAKQSLSRDEGWKQFYQESMSEIETDDLPRDIYDIINDEYKAEKKFSIGDYQGAIAIGQKLCDRFCADETEHGWYLQQLARYNYAISKEVSIKIQKQAFNKNLQLLKPTTGVDYKKIVYINQNRVKRIKAWIKRFKSHQDLIIKVGEIEQNLRFGMPSDKFEAAISELGEAIGFITQRPDKEIKKGPDNLWCGVDNQYFLIECKNEVEEDRIEINKGEAGQMNSHCAWFDEEYGDVPCKRIMITPARKLSYYGDFTHDVEVMRKTGLKKLTKHFKEFYLEFSRFNMNDLDDDIVQRLLNIHLLDIENLKNIYTEKYIKQNSL